MRLCIPLSADVAFVADDRNCFGLAEKEARKDRAGNGRLVGIRQQMDVNLGNEG